MMKQVCKTELFERNCASALISNNNLTVLNIGNITELDLKIETHVCRVDGVLHGITPKYPSSSKVNVQTDSARDRL